MKLIEKKCPNCGAGLQFGDSDTSVTCEFCKSEYHIQRDEKKYSRLDEQHLANAYRFVNEFGKPVFTKIHTGIIIFPIIMFVFVGLFTFFSFRNFDDKREEMFENFGGHGNDTINEINYISKISEIDSVSMETFHDISENKLISYKGSSVMGDYTITEKWTSIGVYLLSSDNDNYMYDVLSQTYKNKKTGVSTTLYVAVKYEDLILNDKNIIENDFFAWLEAPTYNFDGDSFVGAYGYESVEKLYNQLIRNQSGDYNIDASEGLYVED